MKRITIFIVTLAAGLCCADRTEAQNLRTIESRIMSVEARLQELETRLAAKNSELADANRRLGQMDSQPATETYVIRDGDSVGGIARKFGLPRQALLDANNMAEGQPIYIGETLVIPATPNHGNSQFADNATVHTVVVGDTLTGISRRYGTTITAIKQQNGLTSDVIGTGQKLVIPGNSHPPGGVKLPLNQNPTAVAGGKFQYDNPLLKRDETYGYYAVETGDNLYALARDFFTTMKELQRLNGLGSSTIIHPGTELVVPTSKYNDYHQNMAQR